jgi:hypothetical protein
MSRPEEHLFEEIVPAWEALDATLQRVSAARGISPEDAKKLICQIIADKRIGIVVQTSRHEIRGTSAKRQLSGDDLDIPTNLKPAAFDWEASRPIKPWSVKPGRLAPEGRWFMQSIALRREDVIRVLCTPQAAPSLPTEPFVPSEPIPLVVPKAEDGDGDSASTHPMAKTLRQQKRRGRRPKVRERIEAQMRAEVKSGKLTSENLNEMTEEALAVTYNGSRDSVRKARTNVLSELNFQQIPTRNK